MAKKDRFFTCLCAAMLSFLLSVSSIGCMVSAFSMDLTSLWLLGMICAVTAVICACSYTWKLSLIPLCILAVSAGYLWKSGVFVNGLEALLFRLSKVYNAGYGWPIIRWSYRTADQMEKTLAPFLYVMGAGTAMFTAWVVARGHSALLALLPASLPVLSCFVVTDTMPKLVWILLFFTATLILMLSGLTRQDDAAHGAYLALAVSVPTLLAVTLLLYCIPQAGYHRQPLAQSLSTALFGETPIQHAWEEITGQNAAVGSSVDGSTVDLSRVGYRQNTKAEVLRLSSRYAGTVYLRGRALDGYSGIEWYDTKEDPSLSWPDRESLEPIGEVVITTRYAHRMLYLPYYVTSLDLEPVTRGVENTKKMTMYSFACSVGPDSARLATLYPDAGTSASTYVGDFHYSKICTRLPQATEAWAKPLAEKLTAGLESPYHKALAIARYVRQSATYDLETRRMSTSGNDFAQWFLEESDTGYCVHFATATTVLLKAAGIPARYVTGYMAQVEKSATTVVRAEDAHAWTEYWLPGFGWTILESTPAALPDQDAGIRPEETFPGEETAAVQVPTTLPEQTQPADQPQQTPSAPHKGPFEVLTLPLLAATAGLLSIAAAFGQWRLRLRLQRKKRHRGTRNQQALAHWQEASRLSRWVGKHPGIRLYDLAQKARFSQHTLTEAELAVFDLHLDAARQQLRSRNIFLRIFYTLFLALY